MKTKRETSHMAKPLVSVIIPVYNGEKFLAEAIESVLAQTYRPIEILVIDDGSTDGSAVVAKSFPEPVHYFYQCTSDVSTTRNTGVKKAMGSFYAFLDADDLWLYDKLALQMKALESNSDLHIVFGYVSHFFSPDLDEITKQKISCPTENMPGYHPGTMLVSRDSFLRVGLFDPNLNCGEFLDWYSKAKENGLKSLLLPEVVMKRRIHNANRGVRDREIQTGYVRAIKAALDRRRKNLDN